MDPCIRWTGRIDRKGYGHRVGGALAHRVAYTEAYGPIPEGLTVDHLCFQPACVNPHHLQLLTRSENGRRQRSALSPYCRRGHLMTRQPSGRRSCRPCNLERVRTYQKRRDVA